MFVLDSLGNLSTTKGTGYDRAETRDMTKSQIIKAFSCTNSQVRSCKCSYGCYQSHL